jgi:hypothetical protein
MTAPSALREPLTRLLFLRVAVESSRRSSVSLRLVYVFWNKRRHAEEDRIESGMWASL